MRGNRRQFLAPGSAFQSLPPHVFKKESESKIQSKCRKASDPLSNQLQPPLKTYRMHDSSKVAAKQVHAKHAATNGAGQSTKSPTLISSQGMSNQDADNMHALETTKCAETTETKYGGSIQRLVYWQANICHKTKEFRINSRRTHDQAKASAEAYVKVCNKESSTSGKGYVNLYAYWKVVIQTDCKIHVRRFGDKMYGSSEEAKAAAEMHRREQSDKFNQTTITTIAVPESFQMFMALFWDGDGCISIQLDKNPTFRVDFAQSRTSGVPPILVKIQSYYGGHITKHLQPAPRRMMWHLRISGTKAEKVLNHLVARCALKHQQAQIGLECIQALKSLNGKFDWKDAKKRLAGLRTNYADTVLQCDKITIPSIAGFFDAEGCVGVYQQGVYLDFTQESCPRLLEAIVRFLSTVAIKSWIYGKGKSLRISQRDIAKLATLLLPYSIVKKDQLELAIEYRRLQLVRDSVERRQEISGLLKTLKRI